MERSVEGLSTEGSNLTGYFKGNALVKMEARYFGESGKATDELYLRDGHPLFGLHTDFAYDTLSSGKVIRHWQTRYYWNNGRLVRVIEDGKPLPLDAPATRQKAKAFTEVLPKFSAILRDPKGTPSDNR